jgi:hypothetical protein
MADPLPPDAGLPTAVRRWIRTPCGRSRDVELAARPGPWARLRLAWFVLAAAIRDLPLPIPPEPGGPPG